MCRNLIEAPTTCILISNIGIGWFFDTGMRMFQISPLLRYRSVRRLQTISTRSGSLLNLYFEILHMTMLKKKPMLAKITSVTPVHQSPCSLLILKVAPSVMAPATKQTTNGSQIIFGQKLVRYPLLMSSMAAIHSLNAIYFPSTAGKVSSKPHFCHGSPQPLGYATMGMRRIPPYPLLAVVLPSILCSTSLRTGMKGSCALSRGFCICRTMASLPLLRTQQTLELSWETFKGGHTATQKIRYSRANAASSHCPTAHD
mmetsp:Transcript_5536/g.13370  ORF Transcript_5536/g.13370 Transcript_5536/m.13370 type:complete len:257 (-) Transcript_5536:44-814(-)